MGVTSLVILRKRFATEESLNAAGWAAWLDFEHNKDFSKTVRFLRHVPGGRQGPAGDSSLTAFTQNDIRGRIVMWRSGKPWQLFKSFRRNEEAFRSLRMLLESDLCLEVRT